MIKIDIHREFSRIDNIVATARKITATIETPKLLTILNSLNEFNKRNIAKSAQLHYTQTVNIIIDAIDTENPQSIIVAYSGGKASQLLLHAATTATAETRTKLEILYTNTGIDFPDHIAYIRNYVKRYHNKIPFHELKPAAGNNFFQLAKLLGFPTRTNYWCCSPIKIQPQNNWIAKSTTKTITLLGNQKTENSHRYNYLYHATNNPHLQQSQIFNPLLNWDDLEIWSWLNENKLETSPIYQKVVHWTDKYRHNHRIQYTRTGCYLCPLAETHTYPHWLIVKMHYPMLWELMKKTAATDTQNT